MGNRNTERRHHERHDLACPVEIHDSEGRLLARTRTVNISDGGALLSVPVDQAGSLDGQVSLDLRVPRTTPNTYMLEKFSTRARILRNQPIVEKGFAGLALQFFEPVKLELKV